MNLIASLIINSDVIYVCVANFNKTIFLQENVLWKFVYKKVLKIQKKEEKNKFS